MILGLMKTAFWGSIYLLGTIIVVKIIIAIFRNDD